MSQLGNKTTGDRIGHVSMEAYWSALRVLPEPLKSWVLYEAAVPYATPVLAEFVKGYSVELIMQGLRDQQRADTLRFYGPTHPGVAG